MSYQMTTKNGLLLSEAVSTLQKAVRRNDERIACWIGLEIYHSGYWQYVWKRIYTISAEDCESGVTKEIHALFNGFLYVNEGNTNPSKGRIFLTKAIITLCRYPKNRDSDHAQNLVYDGLFEVAKISDNEIKEYIEKHKETVERIPEYAYDCHTKRGRLMGKTKFDFFISEFVELKNQTPSLFGDEIEQLKNRV